MTAESKFRVRDLCPGRQDWFARTEILFQERQSHLRHRPFAARESRRQLAPTVQRRADLHTRYVLTCRGLLSTQTVTVRPVFKRAFREYGLPIAIREFRCLTRPS